MTKKTKAIRTIAAVTAAALLGGYQGLGIGNGVLHEFFILFVVSSAVAQAFFV